MTEDVEKLLSRIPFATALGIRVLSASKGRVDATMKVAASTTNGNGVLHGGATMALADTLGAIMAQINLPDSAGGTTTLESKTNFVGLAREGDTIHAVCTPIHVGARTSVWQTTISVESGKIVAVVSQTQLTI